MHNTKFTTILLPALIGATVILYGMHSKDIFYLSNVQTHIDSKVHGDDSARLAGELHHHIDKQSLKSLQKYSSDSGLQVDTRSLRMLKEELHEFENRKLSQFKSGFAYLRTKLSLTFRL